MGSKVQQIRETAGNLRQTLKDATENNTEFLPLRLKTACSALSKHFIHQRVRQSLSGAKSGGAEGSGSLRCCGACTRGRWLGTTSRWRSGWPRWWRIAPAPWSPTCGRRGWGSLRTSAPLGARWAGSGDTAGSATWGWDLCPAAWKCDGQPRRGCARWSRRACGASALPGGERKWEV